MNQKFPMNICVNCLSIDSINLKSVAQRNQFILFKSPRPTTAKSTNYLNYISKKPIFPLTRNPTMRNSFSTKQLTSIYKPKKERYTSFNFLIEDIYHKNLDSNFKAAKDKVYRSLSSSSVIKGESLNRNKRSKSVNWDECSILSSPSRKNKTKINKLIAANLNSRQLRQIEEFNANKKPVFGKKSSINRLILKIFDPEANLEDYTTEKGNRIDKFILFKKQLDKEKIRLNNLVNNVKKAQVMNEAWLRSYTIRLKSNNSKSFKMPLQLEK